MALNFPAPRFSIGTFSTPIGWPRSSVAVQVIKSKVAGSAPAVKTSRAAALLAPGDVRRLELAPELGLVLTTSGALTRAEEVLTEVIEHGDGVPQSVVLAARIERVLLRSRSDPRGGWEEDLALIEVALPGLESATDLDRRGHRAVARGWFLLRTSGPSPPTRGG